MYQSPQAAIGPGAPHAETGGDLLYAETQPGFMRGEQPSTGSPVYVTPTAQVADLYDVTAENKSDIQRAPDGLLAASDKKKVAMPVSPRRVTEVSRPMLRAAQQAASDKQVAMPVSPRRATEVSRPMLRAAQQRPPAANRLSTVSVDCLDI